MKQSVPRTAKLLQPLDTPSQVERIPKQTRQFLGPPETSSRPKTVRKGFESQLSLPDGLPKKKVEANIFLIIFETLHLKLPIAICS